MQALKDLEDPASRVIGHVLFSPIFGTSPVHHRSMSEEEPDSKHPNGRYRDWALIELHTNRHETSLELLENQVMAGKSGFDIIFGSRWESPDTTLRVLLIDWLNCIVELDGVVPESEIEKPKTLTRSGDPTIMVAFHKSNGGLSVGFTNAVKSVIRVDNNGKHISEE